MPRKKSVSPTKNKIIEVNFGNKTVIPAYDFSITTILSNYWFSPYGLLNEQQLQFKTVEDFFDGDFIYINGEGWSDYGFGYNLTNSILIGVNYYKPHPRKEVKRIGLLVSPIKLSRTGEFERIKD